jgi:hypothetical protein
MDIFESSGTVSEPAAEYKVIRKDLLKLQEELDALKEKLKGI